MLGSIILGLLMLALLMAGPWWPFSRAWGYWPVTGLAAALVIWLALIWLGWIAATWPAF